MTPERCVQVQRHLQGHVDWVSCAQFDGGDDTLVYSGGLDMFIRIWDPRYARPSPLVVQSGRFDRLLLTVSDTVVQCGPARPRSIDRVAVGHLFDASVGS
jgi:WD40 repeat protein